MLKFSALCALLALLVYNAEAMSTLSSRGRARRRETARVNQAWLTGTLGNEGAQVKSVGPSMGGGMTGLYKEYKSKLFSFKKTKLELDIIQAKYALATLKKQENVIMEDPQRPKGFGMTAELARKRAEKFDAKLASEAMRWIKEVLLWGKDNMASKVTTEISSMDDMKNSLKDGTILCALINTIKPGSVKKINEGTMQFLQMANIGNFLKAAMSMGINKRDLFETVDLYEGANIPQVLNGIFKFGRKAAKIFKGPKIGLEEESGNLREFTQEQLRAGEGVIGLQAGSNKGASQAGQNFGKTRAIIDDTANYDNAGSSWKILERE